MEITKLYYIASFIILFFLIGCVQEKDNTQIEKEKILITKKDSISVVQDCASTETFVLKEENDYFPAEYIGGKDSMELFIKNNRRINNNQANIKVMVGFNVMKTGIVNDITIPIKGDCKTCESEATRIVSKMPKWKPSYIIDSIGKKEYYQDHVVITIYF